MPALGPQGLRAVAEAISRLDPDGDYVRLDVEQRRVRYSPEIRSHEALGQYVGEEEPARAYVVAWLIRVGGGATGGRRGSS